MTDLAQIAWVAPVCTVAYFSHRVAIRWLDGRERAAKAAEERNEREAGLVGRVNALAERLDDMAREQKNFMANNRR